MLYHLLIKIIRSEVSEAEVVNLFGTENLLSMKKSFYRYMDFDDRPENIVSCVYCSRVFNTEIENFMESEDGFAI